MWCILFFILFSSLEAQQPVLRPLPPKVSAHLRELREEIEELKSTIQVLETQRELAAIYQQQYLQTYERLNSTAQNNFLLQQKLDNETTKVNYLQLQTEQNRADLQQSEEENNGLKLALRKALTNNKEVDSLLQSLRGQVSTIQRAYEQSQAHFQQVNRDYEELKSSLKKNTQQSLEDRLLLNKQVQRLKNELEGSQMNVYLSQKKVTDAETTCKHQLQDLTKRLEASARSEKEAMEKKLATQAEALEKCLESNRQLQVQLDNALFNNSQLRNQQQQQKK